MNLQELLFFKRLMWKNQDGNDNYKLQLQLQQLLTAMMTIMDIMAIMTIMANMAIIAVIALMKISLQTVLPHSGEKIKREQPDLKDDHYHKENNHNEENNNNNNEEADDNNKEDNYNNKEATNYCEAAKHHIRQGDDTKTSPCQVLTMHVG